jgi:hypothetical protein
MKGVLKNNIKALVLIEKWGLSMKKTSLILLFFASTSYADFFSVIIENMSQICLKPQIFKQAMMDKNGEQFFAVLEWKEDLVITETRSVLSNEVTKKHEPVDIHLAKLLKCQGLAIKNYLLEKKVDINKVTFGLLDYEPVFIIGADPTDLKSPQLWVQKSSFLPVKEIINGQTTIFKWTDKNFPSEIETEKDGVKLSLSLPHG